MFATIRKHQTWLWGFIIAAVIVSFVIYFTPTASRGDRGGGTRDTFGSINGRPVTRKAYLEAWLEVKLSFLIRYGTWPDTAEARKFGFNVERETRSRLILLEKLKELDIQVDEAATAQWILDRFADPKRPGSAKSNYETFARVELIRHGINESLFQRFIQHEVGIVHLLAVAGTAGKLVTPREAANLYRQEQEKIEAEAAVFAATNFLAGVKLDPAAIAQFYTNRQSLYRIPERVQVNYVRFDLTNYSAQAEQLLAKNTNLNTEIDRTYLSSGPNFFTDGEGHVLTPDAAKAKIRQQMRENQGLLLARKDAAIFGNELAKLKPVKAENLNNLAAAKGIVASVTEPFSEMEGPNNLRVKGNFADIAFKLTPAEPISSPIVAQDGVYLISLKQKLPSEIPSLEAIGAKVTEDYRRDQALQLARSAGTNFVSHLSNSLAQGKSFAAACTEARVTPILLPKFAPSTRTLPDLDARIDLNQLKAAAGALATGKPSELLFTREGGFVLYVKNRTPVPEAELKQELPKFMASLRQSQQFEAFQAWFQKQVEASRVDMPVGKDEEE